MNKFRKFVNPFLGELLENIELDKEFTEGKGCYLWDNSGDRYLDCIANYGAVPFGYNPKEIWDSIIEMKEKQEPSLVQPSALKAAGELAQKLVEITPPGLDYVTFTNSGTEAVEAAIKLCRSTTERQGILATDNSFHGKTLGSLSATGNSEYQKAFCAPVAGFDFVSYGSLDLLQTQLEEKPDYYAAFIVEPVQGEGGIIEPPAGYLKEARELCREYGVLFILDEIQTGLGRTGSLFACEDEDVIPDVLLLAKALGGGIVPVGACISSKEAYNEEFANKHSSTFAGNTLACRVGLKALDILTADDQKLIHNVQKNGKFLREQLVQLKEKYPELIKAIRGRGFMLGVEFGVDRHTFPGSLLGIMADQELLTPVISSYLLNKEKLRVAPTLNGNTVIRVEPPLIMNQEQCREIVRGFDNMLAVMQQGNTARFISYLIGADDGRDFTYTADEEDRIITGSKQDYRGRFAFLIHPLDLENYLEFDGSLNAFSEEELAKLTGRWNKMVDPFLVSETEITSRNGSKIYGEFISIPYTTRELLELPGQTAVDEVKKAIKLARERGAEIVGLGAYTSVVTMGGLYVRNEDIPVTTGNSYTVVAAVEAVIEALNKLDVKPESSTAAIVGATGSIGKGTAVLLSQTVSRLLLIGNPSNRESSRKRLYRIAGEIYRYLSENIKNNYPFKPGSIGARLAERADLPAPEASLSDFVDFARNINGQGSPIIISTSIDKMLPLADEIICATNSIKELITPSNLKHGAVVCDISRPKNVSKDIEDVRPDVLVIDGGVIEVPGRPSMGWNFGFKKGLVYACMAETMMLTMDNHFENTSIGSSGVNLDSILYTMDLAEKHGFKLAELRSFDRPLGPERWNTVRDAVLAKSI